MKYPALSEAYISHFNMLRLKGLRGRERVERLPEVNIMEDFRNIVFQAQVVTTMNI